MSGLEIDHEVINVPYGKLYLPTGDHITNIVKDAGNFYEADLLYAIAARRQGGVFLDIGAHCGNHTLFFATACEADLVVAIEPDRDSFALLKKMVEFNDLHNVLPIYSAVATPYSWDWVDTYTPSEDGSLNTGTKKTRCGDSVPCFDISMYLQIFRPDVVKIDIESPAILVLAGCRSEIELSSPMIAAEASSDEDRYALGNFLSQYGYEISERFCRTPTYIWEIP